jgi:hypothetical protein
LPARSTAPFAAFSQDSVLVPFWAAALKNAQGLLDRFLVNVPGYEHDARAAILARPGIQF